MTNDTKNNDKEISLKPDQKGKELLISMSHTTTDQDIQDLVNILEAAADRQGFDVKVARLKRGA